MQPTVHGGPAFTLVPRLRLPSSGAEQTQPNRARNARIWAALHPGTGPGTSTRGNVSSATVKAGVLRPGLGYVCGVTAYDIALLGRFVVHVDGRPVPASAWRHTRAAELVKILALAHGHRLHCEQVMDLLWPDLAAEAAAANLRKAVHFARASLGVPAAISRSGGMLELCPDDDLSVDALAFEAAARAGHTSARGNSSPRIAMQHGRRNRANGCGRYTCGC